MALIKPDMEEIRRFVYRNARPLDLARWQYHMEGYSAEPVIKALAAYQNADGGFGSALEADCWNPPSAPIQCGTAVNILWEIGFQDKEHAVVKGLLRYLQSREHFVQGRWENAIPSNNDFPHAPWWHTDSSSRARSEFNPTAILAGFLLYFIPAGTAEHDRAIALAQELCAAFLENPEIEMHPLACVFTLLQWMQKAGCQHDFPYSEMEKKALHQANALLHKDAESWGGYSCRPSFFIDSPSHPLYQGHKDLVEKELDWLCETRNSEGVWSIPWRWAGYEREFAISENWWKSDVMLRNVQFLRAFGRINEQEGGAL